MGIPNDPAIPFLGLHPTKTDIFMCQDTCLGMALSSTVEWINKLSYIVHAVKYYIGTNMNEFCRCGIGDS